VATTVPPPVDPRGQKVWAITFAIWNSGDLPIRGGDVSTGGDVLKPLTIHVGSDAINPEIIWEVRVARWSRDEIDFRIDTSKLEGDSDTPSLPVEFRILEQGDGAQIDLIYSGPRTLQDTIVLSGSVVGNSQTEFRPFTQWDSGLIALFITWLSMGVVFIATGVWGIRDAKILNVQSRVFARSILSVFAATFLSFLLWFGYITVTQPDWLREQAQPPVWDYSPPP
jgi:hypothetical protein